VIRRPDAVVVSADETLARALEAERRDAAYEGLCLLYVALTRAKRELRVFCGPPPSSDNHLSPVSLIRAAAARAGADEGLPWEHGARGWLESRRAKEETESPLAPADDSTWTPRERLEPVRPSRLEKPSPAPRLGGGMSTQAGVRIHAAFAGIEWLDGASHCDEPAVQKCLENSRIAMWFRAEASTDAVWRERAFDAWIDDEWISGVFDRVILRDGRAGLLDFKTDACDAEALRERHGGQMRLYRRALARLTGLPEARIETFLVHVPAAEVVEIPPA
jgi:ATP-dependent helicase/nuclease subunit A